jgi:hypothetical protein
MLRLASTRILSTSRQFSVKQPRFFEESSHRETLNAKIFYNEINDIHKELHDMSEKNILVDSHIESLNEKMFNLYKKINRFEDKIKDFELLIATKSFEQNKQSKEKYMDRLNKEYRELVFRTKQGWKSYDMFGKTAILYLLLTISTFLTLSYNSGMKQIKDEKDAYIRRSSVEAYYEYYCGTETNTRRAFYKGIKKDVLGNTAKAVWSPIYVPCAVIDRLMD